MTSKKKALAFDFLAQDPKTGMMCEVKIVQYCPPGKEYSLPLAGSVQADLAVDKVLRKLSRYISKLRP